MTDRRDSVPPGSALSAVCSRCGATAGTGAAICGQCGAMLTGPTGTIAIDAGSTVVTTGGSATVVTTGGSPAGSQPVTTTGGTRDENAERLRAHIQQAVGDDYRLLELLGRGGMGIVFRATETALDREVALKVLPLDPLLAPEAYERFEREAKLAARLDHPNIVPIFSVGRRESVAFYTMRLVRGGSVEEMLEVRRRFEYDHAMAILKDVAAALDYAHGRGVVHRDIKPGNILIGETGHALVVDFGIAKALGGSTAGATGTGIIGSPGYMSPEQWRGDVVDGAADQYALAIVAFEMLAGRRPFESPNVQELLQKHLTAEVPAVSTYRFGLHEGVDAALRRALAKNAADRFSTATAFIEALQGLRPTITLNRTGRVPRYEPPTRRRKTWPLVAALALVLAGGAGAFAAPQTRPHAVRIAEAARARTTNLIDRVRYAVVPPPLDVEVSAVDSIAGDSAAADPLLAGALDGAGPRPAIGIAADGGPSTLETVAGSAERLPLGLDPTLVGDSVSGFRPANGESFGYVRVVLHGGVAPIIIDGRTIEAAAGPQGRLVRLEVGRHYVSVRGAGALYVPSQVTVTIDAADTAVAEFGVPSAMAPPQQGAGAQIGRVQVLPPPTTPAPARDSAAVRSAGVDSTRPAGDSARGAAPPATSPDSAQSTAAPPAKPDSTRPPPP